MAVKVVKKQRPSGVLDDRLLRREIDIGKRVADSGSEMLLPVIDAADAGDALLLVMPLADGALAAASVPMGEAEVVPVLVDIATGLQDLHSMEIIHRDLKPANVLRYAGWWKLADFGIARDQEIGTQDPTFVGWGSFPYMAPELWELKSPTIKTDLYALGCLAYELLGRLPAVHRGPGGPSGRSPYPGPARGAVRRRRAQEPDRPAHRQAPGRPPAGRPRRAGPAAAGAGSPRPGPGIHRAALEPMLPSRPAPPPTSRQLRPLRMRAVSGSPRPRQTCAR